MKHTHTWTGLYAAYGHDGFGDGAQDAHYHQCFDGRCGHVMVGKTRDRCSGTSKDHVVVKLRGPDDVRAALSQINGQEDG